jgi:hypothetical protein
MTCAHALALIDVAPFADYPQAEVEAAWDHARQCGACRRSLDTAEAVAAGLPSLRAPAAAPDLTTAVLARIAEANAAPARARQAPTAAARTATRSDRWWGWATSAGVVAVVVSAVLSKHSVDAWFTSVVTPRFGWFDGTLDAGPSMTTPMILLAAGLTLYVSGLFGPLKRPHA